MRLFSKVPDGGKDSGVTAYFLIEWKGLFSIALLKFNKGTRESFHSHAFNAITWWLKGEVTEYHVEGNAKHFTPSLTPKITPRSCFHQIVAKRTTWAITFRGPWEDTWQEFRSGESKPVTLAHGRVEV